MVVELISVGTEILLGNIVNTNLQFLAEKCAMMGLSSYYQVAVGDNKERLTDTLKLALSRSDIVILTGGLGPTEDDITKEVCAEVMGLPLIEDGNTKERIKNYLDKSVYKEITDNNWKQALVPEGAIVVDNDNGTAPGFIIQTGAAADNPKTIILLPGPPNELVPMFNKKIYPFLNSLRPDIIMSAMVKLCGVGESQAETLIKDLIDKQTNPTIATYAKVGEVHLRVTAKAESEEAAKKLIKPVVKELKRRFGDNVYSVKENETLEEAVVKLLKKHDISLTTVESCTGGMLSSRIVNVPGVSDVFKDGFVTYSNRSKKKRVGVNKNTLKQYGAVSVRTVKEMAKGGVFETDADACVAITGIAGPDGGTEEKPVGLVYIGCYIKDQVFVREYLFNGNREKIRKQSVVKALDLLRRCILDTYEKDKSK